MGLPARPRRVRAGNHELRVRAAAEPVGLSDGLPVRRDSEQSMVGPARPAGPTCISAADQRE